MYSTSRPLILDAPAGEALALIEVLVGRRGQHVFHPDTLPRQDRPGPLVEAVARTVSAACAALLLEHGSKPRTVLRRRGSRYERVSGRLWDAAVNVIDDQPLSLRFSSAADALWRQSVVVLGDRLSKVRNEAIPEVRERTRKLFRGFATPPAETAADQLFFVLVHQNVPKLRLSATSEQRARGRLRAASGLARWMAPEEEGTWGGSLLDDPHTLRVVELLLPAIGLAWRQALPRIWQAENLDVALLRARTFRSSLERWVGELDRRGRLDLLDPLVDLLAAVPELAPVDLRQRLVPIEGVRNMTDRDALANAIASVMDPALVDGPRATLAACRYGDERFPEAQLALRLLDDRWSPRRDALTATVRRLEGRIG